MKNQYLLLAIVLLTFVCAAYAGGYSTGGYSGYGKRYNPDIYSSSGYGSKYGNYFKKSF